MNFLWEENVERHPLRITRLRDLVKGDQVPSWGSRGRYPDEINSNCNSQIAINLFDYVIWKRQKTKLKHWLSFLEIQSLNQGYWLLWASVECFEVYFRFLSLKVDDRQRGRGRSMNLRLQVNEIFLQPPCFPRCWCHKVRMNCQLVLVSKLESLCFFSISLKKSMESAKLLDRQSLLQRAHTHITPLKLSYQRVESITLVPNSSKYKYVFFAIHYFSPLGGHHVWSYAGKQYNLQQVGTINGLTGE